MQEKHYRNCGFFQSELTELLPLPDPDMYVDFPCLYQEHSVSDLAVRYRRMQHF